jgi:hypothetical protein
MGMKWATGKRPQRQLAPKRAWRPPLQLPHAKPLLWLQARKAASPPRKPPLLEKSPLLHQPGQRLRPPPPGWLRQPLRRLQRKLEWLVECS